MSNSLRALYRNQYGAMATPLLWEESQMLFCEHGASADLATAKFRLVVIELMRRGVTFIQEEAA